MAEKSMDLGSMAFDEIAECNNVDTILLVSLIDTFLIQTSQCQSATMQSWHTDELDITKGWITLFKKRVNMIGKGDREVPPTAGRFMPNAHPTPRPLAKAPEINIVENAAAQYLMNMVAQMRTQLLNMNERDWQSGMQRDSLTRVMRPWIADFELFVDDLIAEQTAPSISYVPEVNIQNTGVNPGTPR